MSYVFVFASALFLLIDVFSIFGCVVVMVREVLSLLNCLSRGSSLKTI